MTFDPTKPVQTRDGRKARIICTDAKKKQPIVALVLRSDGTEDVVYHNANGFYYPRSGAESEHDLINIPEQMIRWSNVYEDTAVGPFSSRQRADNSAAEYRIGILKLIYEDGKLVDHEYEKLK